MLSPDRNVSFSELLHFIRESSADFHPPIHTRVVLDEYCKKIMEKADLFTERKNGILVGVIAIYCNDFITKKAYLSYFYICPEYRNKGLGKSMLKKAMLYANKKSMETISLNTANLSRFVNFYKRMGYKIIKNEYRINNGGVVERVVMEADIMNMKLL